MLSKRLSSLLKYVDKNDRLIDIGCDHALLDIELIRSAILKKVIVSDIHENALKAGIDNIKRNGLNDKIEARLGNGLEVLTENDSINTILISGMGTSTIISISNNPYLSNIDKLILQSNNDHFELRQHLVKLGFYIVAEEFFEDNKKHYINIVFKQGKVKYKRCELKYGPHLIKNREYLEFELANCERIESLIPNMKLKYFEF